MSFTSHLSVTFDGDEPPAGPPPWAPPTNEAPGAVPGGAMLLRTGDAALSLSTIRVYSTGLEIELELLLRPSARGLPDQRDFWQSIEQLRLGVELADGTRIIRNPRADTDRPGIVLAAVSAGGSGSAHRLSFWLNPVPTPGDLLIVTAHPMFGPVDGQHLVPAAALATARTQVVELWPWEPERTEPEDRPEVPPPPGGWFAYPMG